MGTTNVFTDSVIKNHTICNNVLRNTNESIEAKLERFIGLCNKLINVT